MDIQKLQKMAEKIATQVPDGEDKPVGQMDMNKMFQHTTQMVFKMMENGEFGDMGFDPNMAAKMMNQQSSQQEEPVIEDIDDDSDDENDPGVLPKTKNLNCDLNVTLKELYTGKRRKVHIKHTIYKDGKQKTEKKKLVVPILPGMKDDEIIKFAGEANEKPGHRPGDVVIRICEEPHDVFERSGDNLLLVMDISLSEAFCLKTTIEHLDGKKYYLESDEPIHTNNGVRKIEGLGMPIYDETNEEERKYGDLYIKFNVVNPETVDEKYLDTLRKIFPPLNKVEPNLEKQNKVSLEELTEEEFNGFYDYDDYDDDESDDSSGSDYDSEDDDEDDDDEDDYSDDEDYSDEEEINE